jgi:hypothetical protein
MPILLLPNPDPDRHNEKGSLPSAVAALANNDILTIVPGTWPGNVTFPSNPLVVGANRLTTILPGVSVFPNGATIKDVFIKDIVVASGIANTNDTLVGSSVKMFPSGGMVILQNVTVLG